MKIYSTRIMKIGINRITILSLFLLFLSSCKTEETIQNNLQASFPEGVKLFLNGENYEVSNILPGDTLSIEFLLEANCNDKATLETVTFSLNEISGVPNLDINEEVRKVINVIEREDVINETFDKRFSKLMKYEIVIPVFNNDFINGYTFDLNITANFSDNTNESLIVNGVDLKGKITQKETISINSGGLSFKFKLYNNYVGKSLDDPKGLGFNIFEQKYTNIACELDTSCTYGLYKSTLLSLTYNAEVNQNAELFTSSFGHLDQSIVSFEKISEYNWERNFIYPSSEVINVGNVVSNPIEGDVYRLRYNSNLDAYIGMVRVISIYEDEKEGFVEFEVYINNFYMNLYDENFNSVTN